MTVTQQAGAPRRPDAAPDGLSFQRCSWCSIAVFPAARICPVCGSPEMRWQQGSGAGRLDGSRGARQGEDQPRLTVTVQLDEGPRIMAVLEGVTPARVRLGARVSFQGTHTTRDRLPIFRLSRLSPVVDSVDASPTGARGSG
jgi:uncharacterized OB-fold protein